MASNESQESTTQIPPPPLSISPQLRFSRRPKQPRTVSLPLSSRNNIISELTTLPPTLEPDSVANRYSITVPSNLCVDYIVPSATKFLSRDQLLRKMYKRRVQYRTYVTTESLYNSDTLDLLEKGIEICGSPYDCWVTIPIVDPDQEVEKAKITKGWIIGPVKCTLEMLNFQVGMRFSSDGLKYPWVKNASSTKFHSIMELLETMDISKIEGFVRCVVCGDIVVVGFLLLPRFRTVLKHLLQINSMVEIPFDLVCKCGGEGDDDLYTMLPIICDDFNKIDWLFLFFGMGIGFCTVEQLMYYCVERRCLHSAGRSNKSTLIQLVYLDIIKQLDPERMFRELVLAQIDAAA